MFFNIINLFKEIFFLMGSYSNNLFPDPLTPEEESKYLDEMEKGSKEARSKLIEHNLRLVAHIVKKFEHDVSFQDDLISIGTIGLIKGIDTYSLDKNVRLTTYVAKCAENEILMYFRGDKKNSKNVSIYEGISFDKEGNEITILDVLKTDEPDFLEDIYLKDNIKLLNKYMKTLTKREKQILEYRYGLNGNDELTQKEIASKMGISRSYVSRIEKRATTKILREFMKNNQRIE